MSPDAYVAEGIVRIAGLVVTLEDHGGAQWPLAALLKELAGKAVRIRLEPIVGEGEEARA